MLEGAAEGGRSLVPGSLQLASSLLGEEEEEVVVLPAGWEEEERVLCRDSLIRGDLQREKNKSEMRPWPCWNSPSYLSTFFQEDVSKTDDRTCLEPSELRKVNQLPLKAYKIIWYLTVETDF